MAGRGEARARKAINERRFMRVPQADRAAPAHCTHPILSNALGIHGFGHPFNKQKYRMVLSVQIASSQRDLDLRPSIGRGRMNREHAYLAPVRDIFIIAEC